MVTSSIRQTESPTKTHTRLFRERLSPLWRMFRREEAPSVPLVARVLIKKSRRHRFLWCMVVSAFVPTIAFLCFLFSLALFQSGPQFFGPLQDEVNALLTQCDMQTSQGIEKAFLINLRVATSLTFSEARMLDIAWDIVVAQGGRLFHGWFLYRFVLVPNLGRIMELSPVPISAYLDLAFKEASMSSLLSLIRYLPAFKGARAIVSALFGIFAIGYVLAFAPLLNATTGYLNPSTTLWRMPNGEFVAANKTSPLAFCWTHNDSRLDGFVPRVVESPPIDTQLMNATSVLTKNGIAFDYTAFTNGHAFLQAQSAMRNSNGSDDGYRDILPFIDVFNYIQTIFVLGEMLESNGTDVYLANSSVKSWLYSTATKNPNTRHNPGFGFREYPGSSSGPNVSDQNYNGWFATFVQSVESNRPWFNSSLTYGGVQREIPAPLVTFNGDQESDCLRPNHYVRPDLQSYPYSSMINYPRPCICHRGQPLKAFSHDDMSCISDDGYVWGFSMLMTGIALLLESVWILGCCVTWLDAYRSSTLMKLDRKGGGAIRNAFDLVDATRHRVGDDHSTYSNDNLRRAVEAFGSVRYDLQLDAAETKVKLLVGTNLRHRSRAVKESKHPYEAIREVEPQMI